MSVLIIGYKRAAEIKRVIEKVSEFRPKKLYLAMDGPKDLKENPLCLNARNVYSRVRFTIYYLLLKKYSISKLFFISVRGILYVKLVDL